MSRILPWATAGLIGLTLIAPVHAGNMVHQRTPVLWPEAPCIASVDRASDPLFEFGYAIPVEDTNLTVDELADSRTHQFIGFCRQWPAGTSPPQYISVDDLQRAIDIDSELDATKLDDPEATLETSAEWAGCWTRITPDDQRRPITFAAAAEPVVWDTSGIASGTWVIAGYTWEPPYNLWRRAPWVVRVFDDDSDPALLQPAVTVGPTPELLIEDELLQLELCVAADPEATLHIAWATTAIEPPQWTESEPIPIHAATELSVPFMAPQEAWGLTLQLRARVEAGGGSDYASYPLAPVVVIKPGGVEDGGDDGDTSDTDSTGTDDGSEADTSETNETGPTDADSTGNSCNCSTDPARGNLAGFAFAFALPVLFSIRRRRGGFGLNP
jgi:MYXO-CTERM domain-containing protein